MNLLSAAIEAARAKDMEYPEAEEALNNMNNLLLADEFKQKARLALHNEQWKEALEYYSKVLALDPTDEVVRKESESIENLLQAETLLRSSTTANVFAPLSKWQSTIDTAGFFMNPNNQLVNFVKKQINQIKLIRISFVIVLLIVAILIYLWQGNLVNFF